jgi:hypothetical protein
VETPDGEVRELRWVPLDGLCGWIDEHTVCPDSVAIVLPRLDAP